MEARVALPLVAAVVVLIRLPFLDQAIQGDDVYYLAIARNALVDPLHPMQMGYTFQGERVSMAGHPHPPLNAYVLALLMRWFGGVRETAFHASYVLFSMLAAAAMYSLARRFTGRPMLATVLFVCVPAFVVNGNSLEADLPFLAFWMAGFALYFEGHHRLSAASLALAALGAYQAVFAAPILAHHVWHRRRRSKTAWLVVIAAPAALAAWQLYQWLGAGAAPAGVLAGYLETHGMVAVARKLQSAYTLAVHLGWVVFPPAAFGLGAATGAALGLIVSGYLWWQRVLLAVSLAAAASVVLRWVRGLRKERSGEAGFLAAWGLLFLGGAAAVFYAGSARYLLPLAAPVILSLVRTFRWPWLLWPAAGANLGLGLLLASANYHYADANRRFASELAPLAGERRLWSNAEWGLRYYLERMGGEPLFRDQPVYAGSLVVTSELAGAIPFSAGGGSFRSVAQTEVRTRGPVRLIGLGSRAGYSSSAFGALPFEPGHGLVDRLKAEIAGLPEPRLSYLRIDDPDAAPQLISGFYPDRWMGEQAAAILKTPHEASRFEMVLFIPDAAPARRITVALDGVVIAAPLYTAPGRYTLTAPVRPAGSSAQVALSLDKTFQAPGDQRRLGIIVQELGLR